MAVTEEELRILVTAEVDKAIKEMQRLDKNTKSSANEFKLFGKAITAAFVTKAIVDFGRQSVKVAEENEAAFSVLKSTIQATGAAAWTSVDELTEMAKSLQGVTNYSASATASMQSVLLGFKNIKGDNFKEATKQIQNMASVMKSDLSSAAQAVGKALDDPINGMDSLKKQGFNFSAAQKKVMQTMIDTGDIAGAQKIILDELASTFGGAAEAAQQSSVKIKNGFLDMQAGIGKFLIEMADFTHVGDALYKTFEFIGEAFGSFYDNLAALRAYTGGEDAYLEWFESLSDADKLKEAQRNVANLRREMESLETNSAKWRKKFDALDAWRHVERTLKQQIADEQTALRLAAERQAAESAIEELMHAISVEYEKLGKDDPVMQLQNYQKQLEKIARDRQTLLTTDTGIDTGEALRQLDYNEKAIRQKMDELRADEKKSWRAWLADVLGVGETAFLNGKEAAALYVRGLESQFEHMNAIGDALGDKLDIASLLDSQMADVQKKLTELLTIDPAKIDEAFTIEDASIQKLIDSYRALKKAKGEAYGADELALLQKKIDDFGKSEKELYLDMLMVNGATEEQIAAASRLFDEYDQLKNAGRSWTDAMRENLEDLIAKWGELDAQTAKVVANMGTELASMSFDSAVQGFKTLGQALGEGRNAGEALQKSLADMAATILDQLPMMFMQAGLQLISQGQWAIGLGFIAAAGSTSLINGFVKGRQNAQANALGGVYDESGAAPFAKGGTFTNAIVQSPTFFRFASGAGFGLGLMGEAGPEAVMPLMRGADGQLGVNAQGVGNMQLTLRIVVNNYSSEDVSAQETTGDDGQRQIEITVGTLINSHLSSGKADKALSSRYGIKAQGV